MPSSDYTASSGGALKLKGSAGVTKKKKKNKSKAADLQKEKSKADTSLDAAQEDSLADDVVGEGSSAPAKTEAELRFQENKRKRLEEKMKMEGSKTHKEKVEELNRYLSKLSEHHDMYVCRSFLHCPILI